MEACDVIDRNEELLLRLLRAALNEERLSATDLSEPSNPPTPPETPDNSHFDASERAAMHENAGCP